MVDNFSLSWERLSVWRTAQSDGKKLFPKPVLHGISGTASSSSLVAIMGPSGSGKTTLIGTLSGKLKDHTGVIKLNGRAMIRSQSEKMCGYLYQSDMFVDSLTVLEHLQFMAALKNCKGNNRVKIKNLIFKLSLNDSKNTIIKNLSGGEKRRISLASELLDDPLILFGDEPTTGLDSCSALMVIKKLQVVASSQKLVMISIHQPSSELLSYFTHIILLSQGQLMFHGTTNDIAEFFNSMNYICPKGYNPAEHYIKCVTVMPEDEDNCINRINNISSTYKRLNYMFNQSGRNGLSFTPDYSYFQRNTENRSTLYEIYWLLWRGLLSTKREFLYSFLNFFMSVVPALFVGFVYAAINLNDSFRYRNVDGFLLMLSTDIIFAQLYSVLYTFPGEFAICLREKPLYSSHAYFISKVVLLIPQGLLRAISYFVITQLLFHLVDTLEIFIKMLVVLAISTVVASSWGLCLSAVFNSLDQLILFLVPFEQAAMIVCGFWMNLNSLAIYLYWLRYISAFYYSFESLLIIQWTQIGENVCQLNTTTCEEYSGIKHLEENGLHTDQYHYLYNIFYMCTLSFVCCFIGFCGILYKRKRYTSY